MDTVQSITDFANLIVTDQPSLMECVKKELAIASPLDVFGKFFPEITASATGKELVAILDAALTWDEGEGVSHYEMLFMAKRVVQEAHRMQLEVEEASENKTAAKGTRPADVYRAFARPLRWLCEYHDFVNIQGVAETLEDIVISQSMPENELDNPDWIDPYTGEIDPDAEQITVHPRKEADPNLLNELGWSMGDVIAFEDAQESFNDEDGLDEEFYDEWDVREPDWMEQQQDYQPTKRMYELRQFVEPEAKALRKQIDASWSEEWKKDLSLFANISEANISGYDRTAIEQGVENLMFGFLGQEDKAHPGLEEVALKISELFADTKPNQFNGKMYSFFKNVRNNVRASKAASIYLDVLSVEAQEEAPQDIFVLFTAFQHGLCFGAGEYNEEKDTFDIDDRALVELPGFGTLQEFDDQWGDFVRDCMNDKHASYPHISPEEIDAYSEETIYLMANTGDRYDKNPCNTPAFIKAYLTVALGAKSLYNGKENICESAAWEAWRKWKSPAGDWVWHHTPGDFKVRQSAFWKEANMLERRFQERRIITVKPTGLVLASGRLVDWYVAGLKLKNNELDLPETDRARLKQLLTSHKWGLQFARQL